MFMADSKRFIQHGTLRQFGKHVILNGFFLPYSIYKARGLASLDNVDRLVLVCHGNVCRSPYAEARATKLGFNAISCGIEADQGDPANERAIVVAASRGIDMSLHRTQTLSNVQFKPGDLVIAMETWHVHQIKKHNLGYQSVSLIGHALQRWPYSYIPDPYGLSEAMYHSCFALIDQALFALTRRTNIL